MFVTLINCSSYSLVKMRCEAYRCLRGSQFHHTGPFHNGNGRAKVDFPWERLTGEPLIYASMGTVMNGSVEAFRTIAAALAKHKDLQLVLSVGDQEGNRVVL